MGWLLVARDRLDLHSCKYPFSLNKCRLFVPSALCNMCCNILRVTYVYIYASRNVPFESPVYSKIMYSLCGVFMYLLLRWNILIQIGLLQLIVVVVACFVVVRTKSATAGNLRSAQPPKISNQILTKQRPADRRNMPQQRGGSNFS